MTPAEAALERAILAAHAAGDPDALVGLYSEAGMRAETGGDVDAACFFYTYAYVFALETGSAATGELHARLVTHGREE
jgi:hypothetical protein